MRTEFWSEREKPAHKNHQVDQAQETRAVEDLAEEGGKYRKTRVEKKHKEFFFQVFERQVFHKTLGRAPGPDNYSCLKLVHWVKIDNKSDLANR